HVPTLKDMESVIDLFMFCNLMILMNILDFWMYELNGEWGGDLVFELWQKHDRNQISARERYEMAHAQGLCFDMLCWFFKKYKIFEKATEQAIDGFKEVSMRYLRQQASAIIEYKRRARSEKIDSGSEISVKELEGQMKLCLE
ncbi:hypothetical protein BYT27DRAFT_7058374, partial [Phlegmacium glaucopus]